MANGVADNLLLTSYLSCRCPVFIAPAMDLDMFQHPATQRCIAILNSYGNHILEPTTGELASGLEGKGRMTEPETILAYLKDFFQKKNAQSKAFENKKVLITAGPTFESIDPVRFIGNHSSGKMGYAIAEEAANMGAEVVLISGPVQIIPKNKNIHLINITTASEMLKSTLSAFQSADIAILSAAVADFTPHYSQTEKIKEKQAFSLNLVPTVDIAMELGKIKNKNQILVGFALETNNETANAFEKLKKKNFDFIVLNSLRDEGVAFGAESNKITIIDVHNKPVSFELKHKSEVAKDILNKVVQLLYK
jgi:phosphopantothenoylcysteine decarboxylase / phosphopantothenate---cysteine ligase